MTDMTKSVRGDLGRYRLVVTGRNVHVTEAMKNYAEERISKVEKLRHDVLDIHVIMDIQHLDHVVDIVVKFGHCKIKAHASTTDMYVSIDKAVARIETLLRRWKDRIQDHHAKPLQKIDMQVNVIHRPYDAVEEFNEAIEAQNLRTEESTWRSARVIGTETISLKTLTTDEAVMKMELSGDHFLIFRGEEDCKLKVIFRRMDQNYGIVQVE